MLELIMVFVMFVLGIFALWAIGCVIVKGMFKIADFIFD